MEATVGKSAIVERKRNLANSDVGLKRLPTSPSGHWPCTPPPYQLGSLVVPHEGWHHDRNEHLILDEVELLDVEIIGFSDNETWLYVPPKANQSTAANPLMALKWCRHILEAPEWKVARRSMCLQLESASCWRRLLISPRAASTPRPPSKVGVVSPIGTPPSGTARSRPPLSETPVSSRPHSQSPIGRARSPTFIPHPTRELRQDCASTSSVLAMRRSLSVTFPLSAPHDLEEENVGGGDSALAPPGCHLCLLPLTRTFSSARDLQSSSSFLSLHPPTSPLPSAEPMRVSFKLGRDKMQRSLPNISQVPSVASASFLHTSQSFDSPGWLTRLQSSISIPGAVPIQRSTRVQSTGSVSSLSLQSLKAAAYVGPAVRNSACVLSPRLLGSRIPVLSKPSSLCLSSLSPHWLTFNGTPRPIASCKVAQPRHGYRNMVRLFST
ncbi:SLAIN motif-containing protein 1-like isoform X4 [Syngnathoides biaculeatus]|uniref:SLAIN motif-containing protein 1-like isoform X4 n=1 Tax=Syngnathoides biaculeatus TaxID=300417 RepID=UPI002ADDB77F|nr:SLAIN motif-containing protein 1-like isoform X4 [Syngnathoides biaculeatus]